MWKNLKVILLLTLGCVAIQAVDLPVAGCPPLSLVGQPELAQRVTPTRGAIVIFSGPSGAGKTTVLREVLKSKETPMRTAVAVTTRGPRPGEVDGKDYHFWTKPQFDAAVANGEFIESAEVHGNFYGTLKTEVEPYIEKGIGVFLVIDVHGAEKAKQVYPDAVSVFLKTSSIHTYEQRLRARGTETEANIQKRLNNARDELQHESRYQHTVLNDDLATAVTSLQELIKKNTTR